jgi:hypothetical protein
MIKIKTKKQYKNMEEFVEVSTNGRPMLKCSSCGDVFEEGKVCKCQPENRRWHYVFKEKKCKT